MVGKCRSQIQINPPNRNKSTASFRNDSLSRKADFIKVESKILDDEISWEPSFSSESQGSLRIQRVDNSNPVSFRSQNRSQLSRDFKSKVSVRYENNVSETSHYEDISEGFASPQSLQSIDKSFWSTINTGSDLSDVRSRFDTLRFRKNGYIMKKLALLYQ